MSQRVDFEAMPGIRYDRYVHTLTDLVRGLHGPDGTKFKVFRDAMRQAGVWDKTTAPTLMSLVDVSWDRKRVTVGPLAQRIHAAGTVEEVQDLLYKRLFDANLFLVKYVLEALDVESGGRLHSIHELYRMVTSYVYPGDYITLPCFQAWSEWLAATGYIKLVGIRWALSERGQEVVPSIRAMDLEEILEDMEEGDDDDEDDDVEVPPSPVAEGSSSEPEPAAPTAEAEASTSEEDDLFADLPPEPEPPSEEDIAAAEAAFQEQFADVSRADSAASPSVAPVAARSRPPTSEATLHAPLVREDAMSSGVAFPSDPSGIADLVVSTWEGWGPLPQLSAPSLGMTVTGDVSGLLELCAVAVLVEGLSPHPAVYRFVRRLRDEGFFTRLAGAGGFQSALEGVGPADEVPALHALYGRLIYVRDVAARVGAVPELATALGDATDHEVAVRALRDKVFSATHPEAPFWVVRELARAEVVSRPEVAHAAIVPSRRLLANGARVGLWGAGEASRFQELLDAARVVGQVFQSRGGYGAALECLDFALSLEHP